MNYNYSVIIPHKNCLNLLQRCLNSIPKRNDLEVIVIDDNSGIGDIEHQITLMAQGHAIKIICLKTSKFAGGARNRGLEFATGKWLVFADADDFFSPQAFDIMDEYVNSDDDIIYFSHSAVYSDNLQPAERLGKRLQYLNEYADFKTKKSEAFLKYLNHSPTSKMIKREIVASNNLLFDEVPASNDAYFSVTSAFFAASIAVDKRVVYVATIRRGSITQTRNKNNDFSRFAVDVKLYNFFRQKNLPDMYPWVTMEIVNALRNYGFKEFFRYLKMAKQNHINIFLGITRRFNRKYKY